MTEFTPTEELETVQCGSCGDDLVVGTWEYHNALVRDEGSKLVCLQCQLSERFHVEEPEFMDELDELFESSSPLATARAMYRMIDREVRDVYGFSYGKLILSSALSAAFWGALGYYMGKRLSR